MVMYLIVIYYNGVRCERETDGYQYVALRILS